MRLTDVQNIEISNFDYDLPNERIAKFPLENRADSKLLVFGKNITTSQYKDLPQILPSKSLLVFNNTKVVQARLHFSNENGAKIEVFCLQPTEQIDVQKGMQTTKKILWNCLIGNAKKWKQDFLHKEVVVNGKSTLLKLSITKKKEGSFDIMFDWADEQIAFAEILEVVGNIPLPPYMNRTVEKSDENRYQTVYAKHKGSVAAPTAGLHFTTELKEKLDTVDISQEELTLHVGAGTFMPVKSDTMKDHNMHDEEVIISKTSLRALLANDTINAVGTTSCRSLESLFWLGNEYINTGNLQNEVSQWVPYQTTKINKLNHVLEALLSYLELNGKFNIKFKTSLIIAPGYQFQVINGLLTNFHQPKSTLILLVAALVGDQWKAMYQYALAHNYRFLSYGDGAYLKSNKHV